MQPDPSSYANPNQHVTENISLVWDINFSSRIISGKVVLSIKTVESGLSPSSLLLDTKNLTIHSVNVNSKVAKWQLKPVSVEAFGSCLEIFLTDDIKSRCFEVEIQYETSPNSSALQWLQPNQTTDRRQPFVFSQCQAIHARSLLPCQDTPMVKSPYEARVCAPHGIVVVMGALLTGKPTQLDDQYITYHFKQAVPIPSYLIAIAGGDLSCEKLGHRCSVWAEPSLVKKAAWEFAETERMLSAAEELCGPYKWGVYGVLILPSTFPYGGMENPCLTFVSPTLLAGDRSLVNVIAHEIAHSWTGNLVTNSTWEHFWLNEGHTVYVERLIMEKLFDDSIRQLHLTLGYDELLEELRTLGETSEYSKLVTCLKGVDPDCSYNRIPYEKGSLLLYHAESRLGKDAMLKWLKGYVEKFSGSQLDSETWLRYFSTQFGQEVVNEHEYHWDKWLHSPGMPPWEPKFRAEKPLSECDKLVDLLSVSNLTDASLDELMKLWNQVISIQRELSLRRLVQKCPLEIENLIKIDKRLQLSMNKNAEIFTQWSLTCIESRYLPIVDPCLDFLNHQGRLKYTRPLYGALNDWPEVRQKAIDNFKKQRPFMHNTTAMLVANDLKL